ncbi:aldo/keto reductase [Kineococcus terrestris]|uniref:aldo/keto reductase n=1 Tax=Kineococcus terrestris TaxID=2044856 RepID=UPI0034DADA16
MITAELGSTGVRVTALGFGGAPLGNHLAEVADDDARAALDAAWDAGVRLFDTAPHYGVGLSERRVGQALRGRPRGEFTLSTKVGRLVVPADSERGRTGDADHGFVVPDTHRLAFDFSAAGVRRSLEESLERLGVDAVDVLLVHDPDAHLDEARAGALPEVVRMREEGLVRAVGAGMNDAVPLTGFVEEFDLDVVLVAGCWNLLDRSALDHLFPAAARTGTSVLLGGVFASGVLATDRPAPGATYRYAPAGADLLARVHGLADVAERHGLTLPALAVRFALAAPAVASVLLGVRTAEEVRRNASLLGEPVPDAVWEDLLRAGLLDEEAVAVVTGAA